MSQKATHTEPNYLHGPYSQSIPPDNEAGQTLEAGEGIGAQLLPGPSYANHHALERGQRITPNAFETVPHKPVRNP